MSGKIGTLTFHQAYNKGAALQTYALQQAILDLGVDTEVVDFTPRFFADSYLKAPSSLKGKVSWHLLSAPTRRRRYARFDAFRAEHVRVGRPIGREELACLPDVYEAVVVGSDQVWNPNITKADMDIYFLGFPAPAGFKRSYAASLGTRAFPQEKEARAAELLGDFGNVCVRERSAVGYLSELLGRDVRAACDPVLLLPRERWERVTAPFDCARPYVLCFALERVEGELLRAANEVASSYGADLVACQTSWHDVPGAACVERDAGPGELLGLVAGARAVVTESFHGCCLSVLFERDLYLYVPDRIKDRQSRVLDLLGVLGLEGCRIGDGACSRREIDWDAVRPALEAHRRESLRILSEEVLELA